MSVAAEAARAPQRPAILDRLKRMLGFSADAAAAQCDSDLLARLRALTTERVRIESLIQDEEERQAELRAKLAGEDKLRVEAMTAARLSGARDERGGGAALAAASALRQAISDSEAVAGNLGARLDEIRTQCASLASEYAREQARFLEQLYAAAMRRYSALAPELADAVLDVAAIRRVMMEQRMGNTNGWSGEILLPRMEPGRGTLIPPLLDGAAAEFPREAEARKSQVYEALRDAGFVYSYK